MTLDHATRRTGIGGSDIPVILGLSRYKCGMDLWLAKTDRAAWEDTETPAQEWGHRLEPALLGKLADRFLLEYHPHPGTVRNAEVWERALYTPDGVGDDFVAECKTRSAWTQEDWGPDFSTQIPRDVYAQVQWGMLVLGKPRALVGVLIGGNDFRAYEIPADPAFAQDALAQAQAWWAAHVDTGTPPAPDGGDDAELWLRRTFPNVKEPIDESDDPYLVGLVQDLVRLKKEREHLDGQITRLSQLAKLEIGDKQGVKTSAGTITWTERRGPTKVAWESLATHLCATPEQIAQYTTTGPVTRVFTVKGATP